MIYSAIASATGRVTFANKLVRTMLPIKMQISRLVNKDNDGMACNIKVASKDAGLEIEFNKETPKWNAVEIGNESWEQAMSDVYGIFIPAKEVLSNNYNLNAAVERGNVQFDDTYLDILNAAKIDVSKDDAQDNKKNMLIAIESVIGGSVIYDASLDTFFLYKDDVKEEFNLVSEGIRKLAILWLLVRNGAIKSGSAVFGDEPEANINPAVIPLVAKIILGLQRNGVQIFIATHDYFLCKYLEVERGVGDSVVYHSLYKEDGEVKCESVMASSA